MTFYCKHCGSTKIKYFTATEPAERIYCLACKKFTSLTNQPIDPPFGGKMVQGDSVQVKLG